MKIKKARLHSRCHANVAISVMDGQKNTVALTHLYKRGSHIASLVKFRIMV